MIFLTFAFLGFMGPKGGIAGIKIEGQNKGQVVFQQDNLLSEPQAAIEKGEAKKPQLARGKLTQHKNGTKGKQKEGIFC
jgi:hypothetical protein